MSIGRIGEVRKIEDEAKKNVNNYSNSVQMVARSEITKNYDTAINELTKNSVDIKNKIVNSVSTEADNIKTKILNQINQDVGYSKKWYN